MNLGIALGAGAQEWRKQREDDRLDAREARESEQFGWQRHQHERQASQQNQMDAVTKKYAALRDQASKGDLSFIPTLMGEYNAQTGAFNDGHTVAMQSTPKGQVMHRIGSDGNVVQSYEMSPQTVNQLLGEAMMAEMQYASPEMAVQRFDKDREYGLKGREVGTKEEGNRIHAEHFRRSDATMEQYRRDQASMFPYQQKLLEAQAGYYRRMPHDSGGGAASNNKWVPLANDADGAPVFFNSAQFDPAKPGSGLSRADGKPVQDMQKVYRKFTAEQTSLDPAARKEFTTALDGLGPRPEAKVGFFGGKNDDAGARWDASRKQIYANHGVPMAGSQMPSITSDPAPAAVSSRAPAQPSNFMANRVTPGASAAGLPVSEGPMYRTGVRQSYAVSPEEVGYTGGAGFTDGNYDLGYSLGLPRRMR